MPGPPRREDRPRRVSSGTKRRLWAGQTCNEDTHESEWCAGCKQISMGGHGHVHGHGKGRGGERVCSRIESWQGKANVPTRRLGGRPHHLAFATPKGMDQDGSRYGSRYESRHGSDAGWLAAGQRAEGRGTLTTRSSLPIHHSLITRSPLAHAVTTAFVHSTVMGLEGIGWDWIGWIGWTGLDWTGLDHSGPATAI